MEQILMGGLKELVLSLLPQLQLQCGHSLGLMRLGSSCEVILELGRICVVSCPNVEVDFDGLEASRKLLSLSLDGVSIVQKKKQNSKLHSDRSNAIWTSDTSAASISVQEEEEDGAKMMTTPIRSVAVALDRLVFWEGKFTLLEYLKITGLDHLQEIDGIQHLSQLRYLELENLPALASISGIWPTNIDIIEIRWCRMLLEIPPFLNTPKLRKLKCEQCIRLKAVEMSDFGETVDWDEFQVNLIQCESLDEFVMCESWGKRRRREFPERWGDDLRVYGSKFARTEAMRAWLQEGLGSVVWEAAVQALMWEYVVKGDWDALDALCNYFYALANTITDEDLQYLRNLFFPSRGFSLFSWPFPRFKEYHKRQQVTLFQDWILQTFPLL